MRTKVTNKGRRGAILPVVVLCLVGILGFIALAVDLGMICVARTQCQNAADAAALAGARALTGYASANNNGSGAAATARTAAANNNILSTAVDPTAVTIQVGTYSYNTSTQSFPTPPFSGLVNVPSGGSPGASSGDNWSLLQATVPYTGSFAFAKVFGLTTFNVNATSTAAHRPRDIAIILDYSGSMRYGSLLGLPTWGTRDRTGSYNTENSGSNNPETNYPVFGAYSATSTAGLQNTTDTTLGGNQYAVANVSTTTTDGRAPICADFQQDTSGTAAFAAVAADGSQNYAASSPGDKYLYLNGATSGSTYAKTISDITGSTSTNANWESQGYKYYTSQNFNGYTQGPNYWGKTFFMWPPDPTKDWRSLYFGTTNNTKLWDNNGNWQDPANGGYTINYTAILSWLKNTGPNPFPSKLRSGRIVYYTAIPDTIDTSTFPPTDLNQRFWKDYIDYCLGLVQTASNSWLVTTGTDSTWGTLGVTGYGGDFTWGTVQINSKPGGKYMDYKDNPKRPRLHFWFGPMTMVDFLGNYNLWYSVSPGCSRFCWMPGTCHESPLYACKMGIQGALTDIENNHPNDWVSLIMFSQPKSSATDSANRFNRVRAPLGQNYQRMLDSLWYPLCTIESPGTTITPYDYDNNITVPRAMGSTCFAMPLMLAYNQFSNASGLSNFNPSPAPNGDAGGLGRRGAQKIVIFETDGLPNVTATASFVNNGTANSYYKVRYNSTTLSSSDFPSCQGYGDNDSTVTNQIYSICNTLCAQETASPPGFATARRPVLIHCIGFGPAYDTGSPDRASALSTLQQIQYIGGTQSSATDTLQSYKIINGTQSQMIQNLQQAFTTILQGGINVTLLQ